MTGWECDAQPGEGAVVVSVADAVNPVLAGHDGCSYESPPQAREPALALVELLLGHPAASADGVDEWSCPIAGGRRTIRLRQAPG